jgi:hypothetical protein
MGEQGAMEFVQYDNERIGQQQVDMGFGLGQSYRMPIFDIKVKSHKSNPFSKVAQNEMAKEFYGLGFFNPELADQALVALEMMDFEGKEAIKQRIAQNQTLLMQVQQLQAQMLQMAAIVDNLTGSTIAQGMMQSGQVGMQQPMPQGGDTGKSVSTNPLGEALQSSKRNTATVAKERAVDTAKPS